MEVVDVMLGFIGVAVNFISYPKDPNQATATGNGAERHSWPKATRRAAPGGRWQPSMTRQMPYEPLPASVLLAISLNVVGKELGSAMSAVPGRNGDLGADSDQGLVARGASQSELAGLPAEIPSEQRELDKKESKEGDTIDDLNVFRLAIDVLCIESICDEDDEKEEEPKKSTPIAVFLLRAVSLDEFIFSHGSFGRRSETANVSDQAAASGKRR